jgi:hypothetical protein
MHRPLDEDDLPPDRAAASWFYELDDPSVGRPSGTFTLYTDGLLVCRHASGGPAHAHSRHPTSGIDDVAAWLRKRGYDLSGEWRSRSVQDADRPKFRTVD